MIKCILPFFILFFLTANSFAQETICHKYNQVNPSAEPSMGPRCRVIKDTFYFDGMVTDEMFYELRDHHPNVRTIELNSYGGLVEPAYRIAKIVRERNIKTNVRKGAKCASACTLIFQAGVNRSAHPTVRFLYHAVRLSHLWVEDWVDSRLEKGREKSRDILAQQFIEIKEESDLFFQKLVEYGLDENFITYYRSLPEDPNWFENGNFTRTKDLIISSTKLFPYNVVEKFDFREEVPEF